jgi:hypothetical protein
MLLFHSVGGADEVASANENCSARFQRSKKFSISTALVTLWTLLLIRTGPDDDDDSETMLLLREVERFAGERRLAPGVGSTMALPAATRSSHLPLMMSRAFSYNRRAISKRSCRSAVNGFDCGADDDEADDVEADDVEADDVEADVGLKSGALTVLAGNTRLGAERASAMAGIPAPNTAF